MSAHQRIVKGFDGHAQIRRLLRGGAVAEVLAGAEASPGAGEQHGATLVVRFNLREGAGEPAMHVLVEAVEAVRPVQRDLGPVFRAAEQNGYTPMSSPFVAGPCCRGPLASRIFAS